MRKKIKKIKYFLPFFALLFIVGAVFGYDNLITHPQISAAATNIYQNYTGKTLSQEQITWIILGSVDEDAFPRYLNHYYDPTTGIGLNDIDERFGQVNGISAKEWAQTQTGWVANAGDYSEPAILQNYRNGNKERAYQGIGHILHLMQDMSVPAHTRNDSHSQGDPYENWAKQNGSIDFKRLGFIPIQSIDQTFDELALYSHNNFFSEDTIRDVSKFKTKRIFNDGKYRTYLISNINGDEYYLAFSDNPDVINPVYAIDDPQIHSDYWNLLSPKAVGYSAGVIDYFVKQFEQIDAEKQAKKFNLLANSVVGLSSVKSNIGYMWGDIAMIASTPLSNVAMALMDAYDSAMVFYINFLPAQLSGLISTNAQPEGQGMTQTASQPLPEPTLQPATAQPQPETIIAVDPIAYEVPIVPVVVDAPSAQDIAQDIPVSPSDAPLLEVVETSASEFTTSDVVNSADLSTATTTTPVYHGSAYVSGVSPDALVATPPEEDQEPLSFFAASTTTDTTATSTDSTATSTPDTVTDTATTTEEVIDTATSTEPVIIVEPEIIDGAPIVINEIAWMGTKAAANDEWIELYNKTNSDIDFDLDPANKWTLESKSQKFSVTLKGVIPAKGYFLLERTVSTTTDQAENMVYSSHKGVLVDSYPEGNLYLKQKTTNGTTTVDYIDFGYWLFASKKEERRSLERVSPHASGASQSNWKTYSEALTPPFAKDAKDGDILGTPGMKNSVTGYYTPTRSIAEDTVWRKAYSPYYVSPLELSISNNATLTIEPGTVVKFASTAGMNVYGALRAEGTGEEPIIFTSFSDDEVDGIDSNQNGSATKPNPADWSAIHFYNITIPSVVSYAHMKYGGQLVNRKITGVLATSGARPRITDSVFDKNYMVALYVEDGAHPFITRNTIKNTTAPEDTYSEMYYGAGIRIADASSTADIIANIFEDNRIGISSESATSTPLIVKDNIFTSNWKNGEFTRSYGDLNLENTNNRDSEHKGGFYIYLVARDEQVKTLRADTMPYILRNGITITEGGALTIEPGTVIKSIANPVIVRGVLKAQGTAERPIIFTASADDSDGYDSGDGRALVSGAWKNIQFIGATSSDSILEYVHIRYGGSGENLCPYAYFGGPCMGYKGALLIQDASPTISHATFDKNLAIAVFIEGNSWPTIANSDIRNTKEAIKNSRETIGGIGISIGTESASVLTEDFLKAANNTFTNNLKDVVYRP
ncbi:MAG: right-handed parallel beta-helix repeat-containing protein [Candidatus Azambacteria bacterium]|nr:right-handed parallel beta-helix repeat-containing protein [Candidatus Azambacteria bacterium]